MKSSNDGPIRSISAIFLRLHTLFTISLLALTIAVADDTFLSQKIFSTNTDTDITWRKINGLDFLSKFKFMKFSFKSGANQELTFQAKEHQIDRTRSIKDL